MTARCRSQPCLVTPRSQSTSPTNTTIFQTSDVRLRICFGQKRGARPSTTPHVGTDGHTCSFATTTGTLSRSRSRRSSTAGPTRSTASKRTRRMDTACPPLEDHSDAGFPHGQTNTGATVVIAVEQHVLATVLLEDPWVLHHVRVPAGAGRIEAALVIEAGPRDAVL